MPQRPPLTVRTQPVRTQPEDPMRDPAIQDDDGAQAEEGALGWGELLAEPSDAPADGPAAADLLEGLNEPQAHAVRHSAGPLLILAGAGSGKTRVITRRLAHLVATGRARPEECLAITFTNKAAAEMRDRVARLGADTGIWIATFHALGARLLRREIEILGTHTRDFTIYDTTDRNQLLRELVRDLGYDTTRFAPGFVGSLISNAKHQRFVAPSGEPVYSHDQGDQVEELVADLARAYEQRLERNNALDFDDLLIKTLLLFEREPGVRDTYAHRFRYVLVDEYQDTNRVQYLITRHLSSVHGNLAVCGDPDQSIYAWRGADVRNILDFERDFEGAEVVKLEQNYRSTSTILAAAQSLIVHDTARKPKALWSAGPEGEQLAVDRYGDEDEEAGAICVQVARWVEAGGRYDEVAVLYRANFLQRALERALRLSGVPYRISGGVEFYQRKEIRDLLSYLQLLANPQDDIAFRRAVAAPARGIGARSLEILSEAARNQGRSLLACAGDPEVLSTIRGRARNSLAAFAGMMEEQSGLLADRVGEALERLIEEIDYESYLLGLSDGSGEDRVENVEEWVSNAHAYDQSEDAGGLRGFLEEVALVSETDDGVTADGENDRGRVTLMTLHSAKGLEFPLVCVVGLEDGLLPHARALEEGDGGESEERRLLYVGMTRAMRKLVLSHAETRQQFGERTWRQPSRFLDEIDPQTMEHGTADLDEESALGTWDAGQAPELAEGDRVHHEHFGSGVIERLSGSGANARATVRFANAGTKVLLLSYAKLEQR